MYMLEGLEKIQAIGKIILELTDTSIDKEINMTEQNFIEVTGNKCNVVFSSKKEQIYWV